MDTMLLRTTYFLGRQKPTWVPTIFGPTWKFTFSCKQLCRREVGSLVSDKNRAIGKIGSHSEQIFFPLKVARMKN